MTTAVRKTRKVGEITKSRLVGIDALRGIAAFAVVLFHVFGNGLAYRDVVAIDKLNSWNFFYFVPAFGYTGVFLFFVISGFCIHLRWAKARAKDDQADPEIDFFAFWKRRIIRLYPGYIAAIAVFLTWEYYNSVLVVNGFFLWDLVAHFLMIHNLDNRTVYSMNGVFWTLAIEEQLYLLYFLLLALRRKLGWTIALGITFASRFLWLGVSVLITKKLGFELPFTEGSLANWWIWAMGALAVENYYKVVKFPDWCYSRILVFFLLILAALVHYLGSLTPSPSVFANIAILFEPLVWGGGFFVLVTYVTSFEGKYRLDGIEYKMLAALAFVGLFSYSLYLTHEFVLQVLAGMNLYMICIICLVFAYVFFLLFERPFMVYLARQKQA